MVLATPTPAASAPRAFATATPQPCQSSDAPKPCKSVEVEGEGSVSGDGYPSEYSVPAVQLSAHTTTLEPDPPLPSTPALERPEDHHDGASTPGVDEMLVSPVPPMSAHSLGLLAAGPCETLETAAESVAPLILSASDAKGDGTESVLATPAPTVEVLDQPAPATAATRASSTFPAEFFCPISGEIMVDPVCTMDGEVFERSAIERWLKNHCSNPLTGAPLPAAHVVPNNSLAKLIKASGALDAVPESQPPVSNAPSTARPTSKTGAPTQSSTPQAAPRTQRPGDRDKEN